MKYAIRFLRVANNEDVDILIPKSLVMGKKIDEDYFETNDSIYPYITNKILDNKTVIGDAYTMAELRKMYECTDDEYSDDDVINFFFMDQEERITIIKDGERKVISLFDLFDYDDGEKMLYQYLDGESCAILSQKVLDQLDDVDDLEELKKRLRELSDKLANFDTRREEDGIDSILVKDGRIAEIDFPSGKIAQYDSINYNNGSSNEVDENSEEFSVSGLYDYLKKHIIGHDEELKAIATILFLNYKSNPYYGTESILIPGPTGTGKTATFNTAAQYFNVPFKNINTCNLVPEGIVGTTIEDEFLSLIDLCGGNVVKAEKSIIVFDEFDKLGVDHLDIKTSLVNVFLKVLEGGTFPINRTHRAAQSFNTLMSSKICLGTFVEAYKKDKTIGFGDKNNEEEVFDKNLLVKKGYFSTELLTRFQHFIPYKDLTEDDKRRIILESKLSSYLMKKQRLDSQFGITVEGDEEFADAVLEALRSNDKSVRDLNNIIASTFIDIEYEILNNKDKYKTLTLTRDSVSKKTFDLR